MCVASWFYVGIRSLVLSRASGVSAAQRAQSLTTAQCYRWSCEYAKLTFFTPKNRALQKRSPEGINPQKPVLRFKVDKQNQTDDATSQTWIWVVYNAEAWHLKLSQWSLILKFNTVDHTTPTTMSTKLQNLFRINNQHLYLYSCCWMISWVLPCFWVSKLSDNQLSMNQYKFYSFLIWSESCFF